VLLASGNVGRQPCCTVERACFERSSGARAFNSRVGCLCVCVCLDVWEDSVEGEELFRKAEEERNCTHADSKKKKNIFLGKLTAFAQKRLGPYQQHCNGTVNVNKFRCIHKRSAHAGNTTSVRPPLATMRLDTSRAHQPPPSPSLSAFPATQCECVHASVHTVFFSFLLPCFACHLHSPCLTAVCFPIGSLFFFLLNPLRCFPSPHR
jgi:hypothetical protein